MPSTLFIIKWSDEMFNKVKQIIEEKIKPKLNKSYGDIELLHI
jgi:Fe-S cluster biogenesis protein NfuA